MSSSDQRRLSVRLYPDRSHQEQEIVDFIDDHFDEDDRGKRKIGDFLTNALMAWVRLQKSDHISNERDPRVEFEQFMSRIRDMGAEEEKP